MLEQAKRILFRISSVLSKVEPEPGAGAGSRTFTLAPAQTKKYRLRLCNTARWGIRPRRISFYYQGSDIPGFRFSNFKFE